MPDPKRPHSSVASNFQADADRLFVRSAARAIHVLSAFHDADGPLSLTDIAAKAEIDRSAAQRLVHTLMSLGHIRRSADDRGYLPGLRLLDHTHDTLRLDPVVQVATPVILEMRKSLSERIDFSLYDETRVIYALRHLDAKPAEFSARLVAHF
jgi:IclR family transcriptional regulator, pca regulon regulatory protein